jgi:N utilization substance protein A
VSSFIGRDNPEVLAIIESISNEKGLSREAMFNIFEKALAVVADKKFGDGYDISSKIGRVSGSLSFSCKLTIVEDLKQSINHKREISLSDAIKVRPDAKVGEIIYEEMPAIEADYNVVAMVRKELFALVTQAEKEKEYTYFKNLEGSLITGIVKKSSAGGVLVGIDKSEAFLKKDHLIPGEYEMMRVGDKVVAVVLSVQRSDIMPQVLLSRTDNLLLLRLLEHDIPEIYDGTVQIKAIARDAGSRSKIAVMSNDSTIDPVAVCIGHRGKRIQKIANDVMGEKIDIVSWRQNPVDLLRSAMKEIPVISASYDEDVGAINVILPSDNISIAIGRRGQNARLLTQLVGAPIHFLTEEESSQKRSEEFDKAVNALIEPLDVEEIVAQLLVAEGFATLDIIAGSEIDEISRIQGFNEDIAKLLKERATNVINARESESLQRLSEVEASASSLSTKSGVSKEFLVQCLSKNLTESDIADLSVDEIIEDYGIDLPEDLISTSIIQMR